MPAAGNTGGAGGAKNVARATRATRKRAAARALGPPNFPTYVPKKPGQIPKQAQRQATLARTMPKLPAGPLKPARRTLQTPAAAQATSQRKRASRVAVSAQRKQTGGNAPIIVRRRADVARQGRDLEQLQHAGEQLGVLAKKPVPKPRYAHVEKAHKPKEGGLLGAATAIPKLALGVPKLADKVLSGKTTAGVVAGAANIAGKGLVQATTGDFYLDKIFGKQKEGKATKYTKKVIGNIGKDAVDLPANFIPSLYVPGKESAKSLPKLVKGDTQGFAKQQIKAGRVLADPIVETVKHPVKSFGEHPLGTAAIFSGIEGAVGRAGGAALRKGAAGKAGRRAARTERVNRAIPSTPAEAPKTYDPDVIRKGVQVAGEKIAARRRGKKGGPSDRRMTGRDINREVDQDVRVSRNVGTLADERSARDVAHAVTPPREIGKRKISRARNKPVTAAHTTAVQSLTNATKADVERLLAETEAKAKDLDGAKLRQNRKRQKELKKALKDWNPGTEAHIRQVQERVREQTAVEEADLIKTGVLDASKVDVDRYSTAAVRHGLHDPTQAAKHVADAGDAAAKADSARRGAFRHRKSKNAELNAQIPRTRAAELGPRGNKRAGTAAAEREVRGHEQTLQKAKEAEARDLAAARKELDDARHAAGLAEVKAEGTPVHPETLAAKARLDKANRNLAGLVREAAGRERVSGRGEGRAQEKVAAHDRVHTVKTKRLTEEADRRQTELAIHNRTLVAAEKAAEQGRPYTPGQLKALHKRRDVAQKRADAADRALTAHHATRPGTEPRGPLAALERRGGKDLELRQRILAARAEVEDAVTEHARVQARSEGVPPKQADRLHKAIARHDDAKTKFADPDSLVHLNDTVDAAKAKLAYEQSKGGLEPAAATRLWKAIHDAEDATAAHTKAIVEHHLAEARHRELKDAPYIDSKGVPHSVDDVWSHPAMSGQPEPSFMPHAYEKSHGAVPVNRVKAASPDKPRTGLAVAEGTSPVAAGHLTAARIARSQMITAARNRITIIDKWGYRDGTPTTGPPTVYNTKGIAEQAAGAAEKITGHPMAAFADQRTDGYVLVPQQVVKRLEAHAETVLHRDQTAKKLGRMWRTGVLAFSTRWLTGQWAEPLVRVAVEHNFNPVKIARSYRILSLTEKELKANDPEGFARFETGYKRGGVSQSVKVSRDEALQDFLVRDAAGDLESARRRLLEARGVKETHAAYRTLAGAWMRFWFHHLNGSVESLARRGLTGHELIKDPIIRDRKIALNFADAAKELADGISNGPAANRYVRGVDDSFGQYQGRSPQWQSAIENYTPFIPWFLSSMNFLYRVLPRDHPVLTALGASSAQATEEWRRKYGLYFDPTTAGGMGVAGTDKNLPLSRQGSIPVGKNNEDTVNVSHIGPFGGPQGLGDLGSFIMPQLQDFIAASGGKDFRGYGLTGRDEPVSLQRVFEAGLSSLLTTIAPPVGTGLKLAGVHLPSEPDIPAGEKQPGFGERVGKQFNPLPIKPGLAKGTAERKRKRKVASQKANAKRRKKGPKLPTLGSGGGGGGGLSLSGGGGGSGLKLGGG